MRRFLVSALLLAVSGMALAKAEPAARVPDASLSLVPQAMTHSPQWVYDHFGRPAWASAGGYCCAFRGFATESKGSVLIHAYDLEQADA